MKPFRVLAADDSVVMRGLLARMFSAAAEHAGPADTRFELCAATADGLSCLQAVRAMQPDAVLMDLHMPGMSGLEAVEALRREWPLLPIVMCSTYTARGAKETVDALACGASDYVTKPAAGTGVRQAIDDLWAQLEPKLLALLRRSSPDSTGSVIPLREPETTRSPARAVVVGVSTGGPAALEALLGRLPADFAAPVLIVQHMPKLFTEALASRLDRVCQLRVRQAVHGVMPGAGEVWIAPGDSHMEVARRAHGGPVLVLHDAPPVNHCRPAADVLFRSAADAFGSGLLAVVLTGMGSDGLAGARETVRVGGSVLVQDRLSSAVWGMPGRVWEAGLAQAALPLHDLADQITARTRVFAQANDRARRAEAWHAAA